MGLKICSIASGSTGNCVFIASDTTKILIDLGVSTLRVDKSLAVLGESSRDLSVVVTHSHSDHIKDLGNFIKKHDSCVYCPYESSGAIKSKYNYDRKNLVELSGGDFFVGDITVSPFPVSHDVPCFGYSFYNKGKKISVCTDLGHISKSTLESISDSDLVMIESNHDIDMLNQNDKYSPWLKSRILSNKGHLSNEASADAILSLSNCGVKQFILAHLSRENNYAELAFNTVRDKLKGSGIIEGRDVFVEVAAPDKLSSLFEVTL